MSDAVLATDAGHVRTIQLNRPGSMNALTSDVAWGIVEAISAAQADDNVWVIALTGSGKAFCAGLNLKGEGESASPLSPLGDQLDDIGWVGRFLLTLRQECDKPIVAGINGVAVGAGLSLALASDIRICARSARLMAGYPRIGASPDGGMNFTLSQAIGYEQAMRFLLENRTVTGDEALSLGMVGEVVDDEALPKRLAEYCQMLCERSPITLRLTKRGLEAATRSVDLEALVRLELANIMRAFASEDGKEAQKAFLEKRKAEFKGR